MTTPSAADPVRVRLADLGEEIGDFATSMKDVQTARDLLLAAVNAALDLHRAVPLYDECNHTDRSAGTIAEHAWEAVNGDWVCGESTATCCEECRHDDGSAVDSPCATVRAVSAALGVTP